MSEERRASARSPSACLAPGRTCARCTRRPRRGELGGGIVLVFADRACPALDWAVEQGIDTALVPGGDDATLADVLAGAGADVVVLAGYMRMIGPGVLAAFPDRILNVHPSLLPAFPGAHAVRDALDHGATVTGATVHLVDATLDGGPIVAQEAVPILRGDDDLEPARADPGGRAPAAAARRRPAGGRRRCRSTRAGTSRSTSTAPTPRSRRHGARSLSVSDKTGLVDLGRGLVARGFELVSTGGTARALRDAGLPVTDVAAVTGSPEMLDGRVKTLHPRVHAGLLADRRLEDHRAQLIEAGIAPFELVVVNLYPFAAALERPGITIDELVEEIDIGGPSMVRAAAKNHANVAIVTSPARYDEVLAALDTADGLDDRFRRELAVEAFAHTAAYDARISTELPRRLVDAGLLDGPVDPYPASLSIGLEKVETLRYGENPHQPAARYRRPGSTLADGLFGVEREPLQGKALSYNNVLDAAAVAALGRALRGPAVVIVKHTNPCGAAERPTLLDAWAAALEADPVSAFGGVVALTREVDRPVAEALTSIFLEIVVAPSYTADALEVLATKPNLRVLVDELLAIRRPAPIRRRRPGRLDPDGRRGGAGHGAGRGAPMPRRRGPARPAAPRRLTSSSTSISRGGSSGASHRTRSCWSASAGSSGWAAARRHASTPPARRWPRPMRCSGRRRPSAPSVRATPSSRSRTRSRSASRPACAHSHSRAVRSATRRL